MQSSELDPVKELAKLPEDHYYATIRNDKGLKQSDLSPYRLMPLWKSNDYSMIALIAIGSTAGMFISKSSNYLTVSIVALSTIAFMAGFIVSVRFFFNNLTKKKKAKAIECISNVFDVFKEDGWEPDRMVTPETVRINGTGVFIDRNGYLYSWHKIEVNEISINVTMELIDNSVHRKKKELKKQIRVKDLSDKYERTVATFNTDKELEDFKLILHFASNNII